MYFLKVKCKDKTEAIVYYFRVLAEPAAPTAVLRLKGIDHSKQYRVDATDQVFGGDELSFVGLAIPVEIKGDFQSFVWNLKEL
ncbi:GH36 C-terminal domain-containing protein [Bacillus sp. ISL-7]|uniref:GH36 C-terminal domain-containing protein n=1 Tax=Bacillus sp. ISL-7 TaxID=2819136 RepID=UPI001BEAE5E2|nr:GH36 C-terminal domain-containing protein [Bacillus sp. ISL-7]MBT2734620.1 GH36 C-terminal domain-containing protein [Bacillus sp. ISL-7]